MAASEKNWIQISVKRGEFENEYWEAIGSFCHKSLVNFTFGLLFLLICGSSLYIKEILFATGVKYLFPYCFLLTLIMVFCHGDTFSVVEGISVFFFMASDF